jgi:hypothetical protein
LRDSDDVSMSIPEPVAVGARFVALPFGLEMRVQFNSHWLVTYTRGPRTFFVGRGHLPYVVRRYARTVKPDIYIVHPEPLTRYIAQTRRDCHIMRNENITIRGV